MTYSAVDPHAWGAHSAPRSLSPSRLLSRRSLLVRITYQEDTKIADAGTFTLLKEDHTLGNIIRMSLLADGRVLFAGYRMPHPLENRMVIKIKVRPGFQSVRGSHTHEPRGASQKGSARGGGGALARVLCFSSSSSSHPLLPSVVCRRAPSSSFLSPARPVTILLEHLNLLKVEVNSLKEQFGKQSVATRRRPTSRRLGGGVCVSADICCLRVAVPPLW